MICYFVSTDCPVDFADEEWKDISIISEALKLFLKELPDPLIPFSLHNKFIEAESEHSATSILRMSQDGFYHSSVFSGFLSY